MSKLACLGPELRRNLTNRHIQLIAIGGAIIFPAPFHGLGKDIAAAGPSTILCLSDHRQRALPVHACDGRDPPFGQGFRRYHSTSLAQPWGLLWDEPTVLGGRRY